MICTPLALVGPAREAGIKIPSTEELERWDVDKYPRWQLFCGAQLGSPMPSPDSHWRNAKIIVQVPEDRIRTITTRELVEEFGFELGRSKP